MGSLPWQRDRLQGGRLSLNLPKPSLHWGSRSSTTSCRFFPPQASLQKDARLGPRGRMGRQPTLQTSDSSHPLHSKPPHHKCNTPTCAGRGKMVSGVSLKSCLHNQVSRSSASQSLWSSSSQSLSPGKEPLGASKPQIDHGHEGLSGYRAWIYDPCSKMSFATAAPSVNCDT